MSTLVSIRSSLESFGGQQIPRWEDITVEVVDSPPLVPLLLTSLGSGHYASAMQLRRWIVWVEYMYRAKVKKFTLLLGKYMQRTTALP